MMLQSKNTLLYIMFGLLTIFTIFYFVTANSISHAFEYNENQELYKIKINQIGSMAELYGKKHLELFDEKDTIYITVQDLVVDNLIEADNQNGDVKDPTSEVKLLNDLKIRLNKKNDKITSKVLVNEE